MASGTRTLNGLEITRLEGGILSKPRSGSARDIYRLGPKENPASYILFVSEGDAYVRFCPLYKAAAIHEWLEDVHVKRERHRLLIMGLEPATKEHLSMLGRTPGKNKPSGSPERNAQFLLIALDTPVYA